MNIQNQLFIIDSISSNEAKCAGIKQATRLFPAHKLAISNVVEMPETIKSINEHAALCAVASLAAKMFGEFLSVNSPLAKYRDDLELNLATLAAVRGETFKQ